MYISMTIMNCFCCAAPFVTRIIIGNSRSQSLAPYTINLLCYVFQTVGLINRKYTSKHVENKPPS